MARFEGPQPGYKNGTTKGVMAALRRSKNKEAVHRNVLTPVENRAIFKRLGVDEQRILLEAQADVPGLFTTPQEVKNFLKAQ